MLFASAIYFILFAARIQNPWIFCVLIAFGNLGTGLFNLLIWAFITDVIDYQELQTGSRDDGTIYAVATLAPAVCYLIVGLILVFGYPLSRKVVEENNRIPAERHAAAE